jgi:hypothetical protein
MGRLAVNVQAGANEEQLELWADVFGLFVDVNSH